MLSLLKNLSHLLSVSFRYNLSTDARISILLKNKMSKKQRDFEADENCSNEVKIVESLVDENVSKKFCKKTRKFQ